MFVLIGFDWDMVCWLLCLGKNVVLLFGLFYLSEWYSDLFVEVESVCCEGGVLIYGGGVYLGFVGDILLFMFV